MGWLISLLGLGCIIAGMAAVLLGSGVLAWASVAMLFACVALCILDTVLAVNDGAGRGQVFNWLVSYRKVKIPKDNSYYDV